MMDVGEEGEHNHGGMGGGRIMGDMRKRGRERENRAWCDAGDGDGGR